MSDIKTFTFDKNGINRIKEYHYGIDWPIVYIIENGEEMYIGETIRAYKRSLEHFDIQERRALNSIHIITDEEYNKSASLDIESSLIQYISAEDKIKLQNKNDGLKSHSYYDREKYKDKFELIWEKLKDKSIVKKDLLDLKNSDLFKFSPYKSLTKDQDDFVKILFKDLILNKAKTYIVTGGPGTGKTVLATYLMKYLKEHKESKDLKIALVLPMKSIRETIKKVFIHIKGLLAKMVIGPGEVIKTDYDIIIVDEAHRLKKRKNLTMYGAFDETNKKLGLDKKGTQLDWIMMSSKKQILFYDKNQSVMPADINPSRFQELKVKTYRLTTQMRVQGGEKYINFIEEIFNIGEAQFEKFNNYDFKQYDELPKMITAIKDKENEHSLCRILAGYAWPWKTKYNKNEKYDIKIGNCNLKWNSDVKDWVNSDNSINEVGCIHKIQGYDLNYAGVIIGPELSYDNSTNELVVDKTKYFDRNGKNGVEDLQDLKKYIINIYKTLLTRGIKGTYIYVVDENLRKYIHNRIGALAPLQSD